MKHLKFTRSFIVSPLGQTMEILIPPTIGKPKNEPAKGEWLDEWIYQCAANLGVVKELAMV